MESLPAEFKILTTLDGSPTLAFADGLVNERMHNSQGALGESLSIYGQAVEHVLNAKWPLRAVSVGLGLGYVELITAALCLRHGLDASTTKIWSFEKMPFLRDNFLSWLNGCGSSLAKVYEQILSAVARNLGVEAKDLRKWLETARREGHFESRGEFPMDTQGVNGATCILYDAYSSKTSPELWEQNTLKEALNSLAGRPCVLATYAATGSLKRALVQSGFQTVERAGFGGKRESTFGVRE